MAQNPYKKYNQNGLITKINKTKAHIFKLFKFSKKLYNDALIHIPSRGQQRPHHGSVRHTNDPKEQDSSQQGQHQQGQEQYEERCDAGPNDDE
jgi:hypothetical protein